VGLGPNVTLDATINPDFGQVEADPAVLNLTAFETFFQEQRPFFVEGIEIYEFSMGFGRRSVIYAEDWSCGSHYWRYQTFRSHRKWSVIWRTWSCYGRKF
jgi:hypothetical protein